MQAGIEFGHASGQPTSNSCKNKTGKKECGYNVPFHALFEPGETVWDDCPPKIAIFLNQLNIPLRVPPKIAIFLNQLNIPLIFSYSHKKALNKI